MWIETLAAETPADPADWMRLRVDGLCADGARGPLYVFLREPPDAALAAMLGWVAIDRRLEPVLIAASGALVSRSDLQRVQPSGAHTLYATLDAAGAGSADPTALERWRPALRVLTNAPALMPRVRVGAHLLLTTATAGDVTRALQLCRRVGNAELLLWDGGCPGMEATGLPAAHALHVLEQSIGLAEKLGVRLRAIGFERTRATPAPAPADAAVATRLRIELLREGIPLPTGRGGLLACDGAATNLPQCAADGRGIAQLAFELAATGSPLLDLPACIGGPPPAGGVSHPGARKVEACSRCRLDTACAGVPAPLLSIAGLREELRPLTHWAPIAAAARVAVLCPVVTDVLYGATFFSLARALAGLGARVDLISPWSIHRDIDAAFTDRQPLGQPAHASAVDEFVAQGDVDAYDLIVTPDLQRAHALIAGGRVRADARLAATDFHLLWGMDAWVRDLCPAGRRPEEGGWWPSDQVVIYSAFPGYARLYTRFGVPLRQVAWQPYALDGGSFVAALPAAEGEAIISAGRHLRDVDTLLGAAAGLPATIHPIDLYAEGAFADVPPHIRFRGTVPSGVFCPQVGRCRFMLVPLQEDPHKAAGITAMATATLYGRPMIASATAAARDYVVDGVNGLLVPPGDRRALHEAIVRLDSDAALLARLAAGARAAAAQLGTDAWASALLFGRPPDLQRSWISRNWSQRRGLGDATAGAAATV